MENTQCIPTCTCNLGFGGEDCSLTTAELELRDAILGNFGIALSQSALVSKPSLAALESLTSNLRSFFNEFEVSSARSMGQCSAALSAVTAMLPAYYSDASDSFGQEIADILSNFTSSPLFAIATENITTGATALMESLKDDLIGNQPETSFISRNLRVSCLDLTLDAMSGYELSPLMSAWEQQYTDDVQTYFKLPTSVNSTSQCEYFEDYGMYCLRSWGQLPFPAARTNTDITSVSLQIIPYATSPVAVVTPVPLELAIYSQFLVMQSQTNWSSQLEPKASF